MAIPLRKNTTLRMAFSATPQEQAGLAAIHAAIAQVQAEANARHAEPEFAPATETRGSAIAANADRARLELSGAHSVTPATAGLDAIGDAAASVEARMAATRAAPAITPACRDAEHALQEATQLRTDAEERALQSLAARREAEKRMHFAIEQRIAADRALQEAACERMAMEQAARSDAEARLAAQQERTRLLRERTAFDLAERTALEEQCASLQRMVEQIREKNRLRAEAAKAAQLQAQQAAEACRAAEAQCELQRQESARWAELNRQRQLGATATRLRITRLDALVRLAASRTAENMAALSATLRRVPDAGA